MSGAHGCRVNDLAGRTPSRVDGGGVKQTVAPFQPLGPSVRFQNVALNQFEAVFSTQVGSMGLHVVGFGRVVEIAYRPANGVPVLEQVSNDVVPDVPVHPRDENSSGCEIAHTAAQGTVSYEPSSATRHSPD